MNENLVQKSINITFNSFYFFIHWMFGCCVCSGPKCSGFEGGEQVRINYVVEISAIFPHQTAFLLPSFVSNWRKTREEKNSHRTHHFENGCNAIEHQLCGWEKWCWGKNECWNFAVERFKYRVHRINSLFFVKYNEHKHAKRKTP